MEHLRNLCGDLLDCKLGNGGWVKGDSENKWDQR